MQNWKSTSSSVVLAEPQRSVSSGHDVPMDRAHDAPRHETVVDAWLARSIDCHAPVEIVRVFHAALNRIWSRAITVLGPVTLTAIAERVLHNATERYTFLSAIERRSNDDVGRTERLHERLVTVPRAVLIEGLRYGLIELLTVIGTMTAEVLRGDLHDALEAVTAPDLRGIRQLAIARGEVRLDRAGASG